MKCPLCGTWSAVIDSRIPMRRRECANGHRFTTEEILNDRTMRLNLRDEQILADERPQRLIAADHGLSINQVSAIKNTGRAVPRRKKEK